MYYTLVCHEGGTGRESARTKTKPGLSDVVSITPSRPLLGQTVQPGLRLQWRTTMHSCLGRSDFTARPCKGKSCSGEPFMLVGEIKLCGLIWLCITCVLWSDILITVNLVNFLHPAPNCRFMNSCSKAQNCSPNGARDAFLPFQHAPAKVRNYGEAVTGYRHL